MIPEGCPPLWIGWPKNGNGTYTEERSQVGHTRVMTEKKPGLHKNAGKRRESKISKDSRPSTAYLQHMLNRILISRPLDDNR
jgi:hypothetical protein